MRTYRNHLFINYNNIIAYSFTDRKVLRVSEFEFERGNWGVVSVWRWRWLVGIPPVDGEGVGGWMERVMSCRLPRAVSSGHTNVMPLTDWKLEVDNNNYTCYNDDNIIYLL